MPRKTLKFVKFLTDKTTVNFFCFVCFYKHEFISNETEEYWFKFKLTTKKQVKKEKENKNNNSYYYYTYINNINIKNFF